MYERLWPWKLLRLLLGCESADQQWERLAGEANTTLLEVVDFTVHLRRTRNSRRLELELPWQTLLGRPVDSALPAIVSQSLAAITGGERVHLCADCSVPYPVQRRRKNGRCAKCRLRARSESTQRSKRRHRVREASLASES